MTTTFDNQQWFYIKRPEGRVGAEHYELRESALPAALARNEVIVRAGCWPIPVGSVMPHAMPAS